MNRAEFLTAVIRLFLAQPGAPARASRNDWAVAQALYARGVDLRDFGHAVRLATLRRIAGDSLLSVRSLAYYRQVLEQLTTEDRDAGYVRYVDFRYQQLARQRALSPPESRGF